MNEKDKEEIEKKIDNAVLIALVFVFLTLMIGASLPMLSYWLPSPSSIGQNAHSSAAIANSAAKSAKVAHYMTEEQVTRLVWRQNIGMLYLSVVSMLIGPGLFAFFAWLGKAEARSVRKTGEKDQEKNTEDEEVA